MDKYRIIEVKQHGLVWYEVQEKSHESDYRGGSYPVWKSLSSRFNSLEDARTFRDKQIQSKRVERVVE